LLVTNSLLLIYQQPATGNQRPPRRSVSGVFFGTDYLGDFEERAVGFRGVLQDLLDGKTGLDDILTEDVVHRHGMGDWLDAGHVDGLNLRNVLQNRLQLHGEPLNPCFWNVKTGELGDVANIIRRY
jgi:hypothetical protein